jgi:hypothetical protein
MRQTLYWNWIQSMHPNAFAHGLRKRPRQREWLSEPPNITVWAAFCGLNLTIAINESIGFGRKGNKTRGFLLGFYTPKHKVSDFADANQVFCTGGSGSGFCITTNGVIRTRIRCQDSAELFKKPQPRQDYGHVASWASQALYCQ